MQLGVDLTELALRHPAPVRNAPLRGQREKQTFRRCLPLARENDAVESSDEPVARPVVGAGPAVPLADGTKRPERLRLAGIAVVCGVLLGGVNSLSNVLGSPYSRRSLSQDGILALEVLAAVLGTTWAWALTAFGAAWWAQRTWAGPVVGVAALWVADLTYYLSDSLSGYAEFSSGELIIWGMLAIPVGLGMGLLGALAAQPRPWSILPGLSGPGAVVVLASRTGSDRIQPWPAVVSWAVGAALTTAVVASWALSLRENSRQARPDAKPPG